MLDRSFVVELPRNPLVGEMLQPLTAEVAAAARRNTRSRSVAAGIAVVVGLGPNGFVGRVVGDDFKTGWFEFGTSRIPAEHLLSRALEEVVGSLRGGPET